MDALQQSLSPLNWNLLMSGCPLFKSTNKCVRLAVCGYGCLLVIADIFLVVSYIYSGNPPEASSLLLLLMFSVWNVAYSTLAVSTLFVIWSSRKGFLRILSKISTLLSNEDKKRLHFLSLLLLVYKILFMLVYRGSYSWSWYNKLSGSWHKNLWSFLPSIVNLSVQLHDWELIIISLFIPFLYVIHLAEKNVMNILNQNLQKIGPVFLYRQLHAVLSLKEHFMECVSFLPLFLYSFIFIESVGCIVRLHLSMDSPLELNDKRLTAILLNTRNIMIVSHTVLLTLYTDHLSCQSTSHLKKMEYEINTKHDHLRKRNVLLLIQEAKMYEYRAANFFVINKELLLSFFSAFVTFTVLFVQLINQSK